MDYNHVFVLPPQLNIETVEEIKHDFCNWIMDHPADEIVWSFSEVKSIDTAGLQLILACYKSSARNGKQFVISNVSKKVMEMIKISGVADVLSIRG